MSNRLALMIDLERCTGCKSCEVACKTEHGLGAGERRNRVLWLPGQTNGAARPALDFLTMACQHCDRPACLRACPVNPKAIAKDPDTGVVQVLEDRCVGCGECVAACPYGAMGYDADGHHAVKCDLCAERRAEGDPTTACASVCPTRAITFGERDSLLAEAEAQGRMLLDNDPWLLEPATLYLDRLIGEAQHFTTEDRAIPGVSDSGGFESQPSVYPFGAPRAERLPDTVIPGGCNICFNACPTKYHFRDGRLVKITGNDDDPLYQGRVCPKSQLSLQLYTSEKRLTRPLKRVGKRGEGRFEPISWDQALDEITDRIKAVRDAHGPEGLGIFAGTRTGTLANKGYIRMFYQMFGTPNFETTEPYCSSGKNIAFQLVLGAAGSGNSYTPDDMGSAGLYVYVGDNQAETRPVHFGMINDWRLKNGARMIVVDPRQTVTASKANWHLPVRPGSDLALFLALAHHIFEADLHDHAFCRDYVEGWEQWRDFLFEKGYSPDWAAPICDLSAVDIRRLAEEIATADGCVIFGSRGLNQHTNSVQNNRAIMFVAAITGNMGRKGGAYFNVSSGNPAEANAPVERRTAPRRPRVRTSPAAWTDAMLTGEPYPLKALIANNNPMALWPSQEKTRKAFEALDLLVHIDLYLNETSAFADYVLPVATGIEKGEISRASEDRRIVWIDRMIDPPGEAKADGWIWIELGKRFGFADVMKEEWKDPARFWDEAMIHHPQVRGITQAHLHATPRRWLRFPMPTEDSPEIDTLYTEGTTAPGAPEGHRFPTPSGKLEFWTEAQEAKFQALGLSALPEFYGEREALIDMPYMELLDDDRAEGVPNPFLNGAAYAPRGRIVSGANATPGAALREQGFTLELVSGRPPAPHFHSWTHNSWQAQEMWPDLYCQIHPDTAGRLGIRDGERVRIETSHGETEARAWVYAGIRKTAVFIPIGWGEKQPYHPWKPVNFLTDKGQRCPISEQTNLKSLLCRVSRAA